MPDSQCVAKEIQDLTPNVERLRDDSASDAELLNRFWESVGSGITLLADSADPKDALHDVRSSAEFVVALWLRSFPDNDNLNQAMERLGSKAFTLAEAAGASESHPKSPSSYLGQSLKSLGLASVAVDGQSHDGLPLIERSVTLVLAALISIACP